MVRVPGLAGSSLPNFDPENQCEFDGRLRVPFVCMWSAARVSISKSSERVTHGYGNREVV